MRLSSSAFEDNGLIPITYTCEGENISPPITISEVPDGSQSLVLICDDPDATTDPKGPGHTYDHWVVFNIPPDVTGFGPDAVPTSASVGLNSTGQAGYTGPCPPTGEHSYIFRLYALDTVLNIDGENSGKGALVDAMHGHIIDQVDLRGRYQKTN